MNLDAIESCLERAAEQSSVWAVIREAAEASWVIVLPDQSMVDAQYDPERCELRFQVELGLVQDATQRAAINELIVRCQGVIPVPTINLTSDQRYELLTRWPMDPVSPEALGAYFDDVAAQASLWREVVNQPLAAVAPQVPDSQTLHGLDLLV
ncbi:MAG: hypothetical protein GTN84_15890 [Hydrogenophaga sp.]|uniref:hypothetical protein n=1 Tax=Hydrogenophaga sp. TaxID=1904254 RepID=UPI0016B27E4F|nr:hypothetical protein [Hydrogenophaga sp.]NIM42859.1 hypothetical protein [Hydrogenophaga sp.]NIN27792.1 hypothetical protein [Hydrogenophaga sp.]NIN32611.1 hypothetical protein [Hydrogenophaga sp.]NIN57065.1 hypothetical protein [Hydrogenophaga sp.]NIO53476.1 hypothetical protein [Hydrogenophaga sp.]